MMAEESTRLFFAAPAQHQDTGTARLVYRRFGSGPPLLLVHGFPLSGFTWRKVLPALAERYTCYVPDLPGMGESGWTDATTSASPGRDAR
jgi:haloalkane dehalogenase